MDLRRERGNTFESIGIFLFCCMLLGGCSREGGPIAVTDPDPRPQYAPGEVVVAFNDQVNEQEADAMVARVGLSWTSHFTKPFLLWVEILSGDPAEQAGRLRESPLVAWAEQRGNPNGREGAVYLAVGFNETATVETAEALIASDPERRVSSVVLPPKWGVVRVEPGSEQHWIELLQQESIVRSASLNYRAEPSRP